MSTSISISIFADVRFVGDSKCVEKTRLFSPLLKFVSIFFSFFSFFKVYPVLEMNDPVRGEALQ